MEENENEDGILETNRMAGIGNQPICGGSVVAVAGQHCLYAGIYAIRNACGREYGADIGAAAAGFYDRDCQSCEYVSCLYRISAYFWTLVLAYVCPQKGK